MFYKHLNITNMSFVEEYAQKCTSKNVFFSPSTYPNRLVTYRKRVKKSLYKYLAKEICQ